MKPMAALAVLFAVAGLPVVAGAADGAIIPLGKGADDKGWTGFERGPDTQVHYVSSSAGDDANDGLSAEKPLKTLAAGVRRLRTGRPDWLLLKRGDVWYEAFGSLSASGPSADAPILIGSYGEGTTRPKLMLGEFKNGLGFVGRATSNVAVLGIHFYDDKGDPRTPQFVKDRPKANAGIWYFSLGENILIEDCRFEMLTGVIGLGQVWTPEGQPKPEPGMRNLQVRRCVVEGAWSSSGHCQGCFFDDVHGLLLEENVLDHNGWNTEAGDLPTVFNHNVYITIRCDNVVARGNIVARGSTTGLYCRTNGVLEDNLCVDNAPALNLGRITDFRPGGVSGRVAGNVVFGAPNRPGYPNLSIRNEGIEVGNINLGGVVVEDNIVIGTDRAEGTAFALSPAGVGVHNATFRRNIACNWPRALGWVGLSGEELVKQRLSGILFEGNLLQLQRPADDKTPFLRSRDAGTLDGFTFRDNVLWHDPPEAACVTMKDRQLRLDEWAAEAGGSNRVEKLAFVDPLRTVATYQATLGGEQTLEAFLKEACQQSKDRWREEYTARAVIQYVREGFRAK